MVHAREHYFLLNLLTHVWRERLTALLHIFREFRCLCVSEGVIRRRRDIDSERNLHSGKTAFHN
jgi:hypothetical protein